MCKCTPAVRTPCCGKPGCCCPRCFRPSHPGACQPPIPEDGPERVFGEPVVYVVDEVGDVPPELVEKLLAEEPVRQQAAIATLAAHVHDFNHWEVTTRTWRCACGERRTNAEMFDVPVRLDDDAREARCPHRYVRPEVPARILMTAGEHHHEVVTTCIDCGQRLGAKVTVTIELVPVP